MEKFRISASIGSGFFFISYDMSSIMITAIISAIVSPVVIPA